MQVPCGEIDGHVQQMALLLQSSLPGQCRLEHPEGERANQARLFSLRDECIGRQKATLRMVPAHQRFQPHNTLMTVIDLRLVIQA